MLIIIVIVSVLLCATLRIHACINLTIGCQWRGYYKPIFTELKSLCEYRLVITEPGVAKGITELHQNA